MDWDAFLRVSQECAPSMEEHSCLTPISIIFNSTTKARSFLSNQVIKLPNAIWWFAIPPMQLAANSTIRSNKLKALLDVFVLWIIPFLILRMYPRFKLSSPRDKSTENQVDRYFSFSFYPYFGCTIPKFFNFFSLSKFWMSKAELLATLNM